MSNLTITGGDFSSVIPAEPPISEVFYRSYGVWATTQAADTNLAAYRATFLAMAVEHAAQEWRME